MTKTKKNAPSAQKNAKKNAKKNAMPALKQMWVIDTYDPAKKRARRVFAWGVTRDVASERAKELGLRLVHLTLYGPV